MIAEKVLESKADDLLKAARARDCYPEKELRYRELREHSIVIGAAVAGCDSPDMATRRPKHPKLTRKQREILRLRAELGSNAAVAQSLGVTPRAVQRTVERATERVERREWAPEPSSRLPGLMALIREQFGHYVTVERNGDGSLVYHERSNYPRWLMEAAEERYQGRI